jgi:nicotinate phosphoribosyltransferase
MNPIIKSILDTDLYKLTMQQAVLEKYPDINVSYRFTNRGDHRFSAMFVSRLKDQIQKLSNLKLTDQEYEWLKNLRFISPAYLEYLKNYRFNPNEVRVAIISSGDRQDDLVLDINGPWHRTILWEVPLMALISELYFTEIDTDWDIDDVEYAKLTLRKDAAIGHSFAEMGTRRRRSYHIQDLVVRSLAMGGNNCFGTSNVLLAMKYGLKPIGTQAHEWIMGHSAICGLRHANRYSMDAWGKVYRGDLGIALTDTYGTPDFFEHFDMFYAKLFDGVRHDSGCPFKFADQVVQHYNKLNIDPCSKSIIFSDGLDPIICGQLNEHCEKLGIKWSFGIGTNLTNDKIYFGRSKPLNMVIKLRTCDGVEVVKLSDDVGKATGEDNAVAVALHTFHGKRIV